VSAAGSAAGAAIVAAATSSSSSSSSNAPVSSYPRDLYSVSGSGGSSGGGGGAAAVGASAGAATAPATTATTSTATTSTTTASVTKRDSDLAEVMARPALMRQLSDKGKQCLFEAFVKPNHAFLCPITMEVGCCCDILECALHRDFVCALCFPSLLFCPCIFYFARISLFFFFFS
jgi:hypothetical protein